MTFMYNNGTVGIYIIHINFEVLVLEILCQKSPRSLPGSVISQEGSQDSVYTILKSKIYYSKRIQSKISKGKSAQIPPATSCDNAVYQRSSLQTRCPRFYRGLVTLARFIQPLPRCQTPRRKAGVQHTPYCLYTKLRHSETLSTKVGRTLLKSTFPDASQRQTCKQAFSRIAIRPGRTPFCTDTY